MPVFTFASTEVSGDILSNVIWTKAKSPFIITGQTTIPYGVTITIQPGVVVKFATTTGFLFLEGTINARGTSANKIYFTSIKDDSVGGDTNGDGTATLPLPRDWQAIYTRSSAVINLDNAVIRYGGGGRCGVCNGAGIFGSGRLSVLNSKISDNGRYGLFFTGGDITITSTEITRQSYGINASSVSVWNLNRNSIHDNSLYGVSNSTSFPIADVSNNWWGTASGPFHPVLNPTGTGNRVSDKVNFDQWLVEDPLKEQPPLPIAECCSNVAFIPGLQATRLDLDGNRLWEPNRNLDVETLYFTDDRHPITAGIRTDGIIDAAAGFNIYKNFISFMDGLVTAGTIQKWEPFPYDWRFGVEDVVDMDILLKDGSIYRMTDEIVRLAASSPTGKVTIITHSNGGLVAKALISKLEAEGYNGLIDELIMVAAPQQGTPKALAGILHGDDQTIPSKLGFILSKRTARGLAEDIPSAYTLLPSKRYISDVFDPVIEFDPEVSEIYDFPVLYGDAINSRPELDSFLLGDNGVRWEPDHGDTDAPNVLDANLLREATSTQDMLDAWTAPAGVKVIQIAGWGLDTIRGIRYDDCDIPLCPDTLNHLDRELLMVHDGDGTVVIPSAVAMEGTETYYVNLERYNDENLFNRNHADILEIESIRFLLKVFIEENFSALPNYISLTKPAAQDEEKRLRFRIHSPVSLDLYDSEGNHTGLIPNTDPNSDLQHVEQQIPNSYYLEFGETKYAGADTFGTTTVVLVGQANGTFSFEIDEVLGDDPVATTSFSDIPVIKGARVTTNVAHIDSSTVLSIDMDNDGVVDVVVKPGEGISVNELIGMLRGIVRSIELEKNKEKKLLKSIDKLEKALKKEYKDEKTAKKRTDQAFKELERSIQNFEKKKVLTVGEVAELLHILEQIKAGVVK